MTREVHAIADPLYGFISIDEFERKLINSRPFQRLRDVKQMSVCRLTYPGAEHSRFSHSLGVMEVATRMFDTMCMNSTEAIESAGYKDKDIKYLRILLRISTLLHDIGHFPFSHTGEDYYVFVQGGKPKAHERMTRKLIEETEICQIIDSYKPRNATKVSASDVVAFMSKKSLDPRHQFIQLIFEGENIDADKIDYLLRDSYYTGVQCGQFDHERLFHTLRANRKKDGTLSIALQERGIHALEQLLLARYFMFEKVCYHTSCRAFHHHLILALEEAGIKWTEDVNSFLRVDDIEVLHILKEQRRKGKDHARRIIERDPYVVAYESKKHIPKTLYSLAFRMLQEELESRFPKQTILDEVGRELREFDKDFKLIGPRGGEKSFSEKTSVVLGALTANNQFRILCAKEHEVEIRDYCKSWYSVNVGKE